ncbi:DUF2497 domain-containing protein [Caulobacter segnis]|uniref:DUF2497 domain-containing protein n=1 Tax=Caulobacter segnis TaxID=88688 RepID=UPI00240FFC23|nr:DUF2497 domain-containing protein [Caulobacter segnis]MDG2522482.1 DUF2497 domain-containing protein [Caulobacter segnis]
MSDAAQEPTMEEILASIRRIISEDDAPAEEGAAEEAAAPAAEDSSYEEYTPDTSADDEGEDVLELTEPLDAPVESHGDLDVYTPPAAAAPEPEPALPPLAETERLVGDQAAAAAASAFTSLSAAITMPKEGRTLEDVVREMLRPMLKSWLDDNLPRIVEAQVAQEVERIARQRAG